VSTATTYRPLSIPKVLLVFVIVALVAISIALTAGESQHAAAAARPAPVAGAPLLPMMSGEFADRPLA
jgi:hypothetical protein